MFRNFYYTQLDQLRLLRYTLTQNSDLARLLLPNHHSLQLRRHSGSEEFGDEPRKQRPTYVMEGDVFIGSGAGSKNNSIRNWGLNESPARSFSNKYDLYMRSFWKRKVRESFFWIPWKVSVKQKSIFANRQKSIAKRYALLAASGDQTRPGSYGRKADYHPVVLQGSEGPLGGRGVPLSIAE